MSYILDALKKIEHEKNKKPAPDGRVSIAGDLFHERTRPPVRAGIWKIVAIIAVASLATAAGTWYLLREEGRSKTADIRPSLPPSVPVIAPVVIPPAPAPVSVSAQPVQVAAPPAAISPPAAVMQKKEETAEDDEEAPRTVRRINRRTAPQSVVPKQTVQPAQTVQAPADIKLSGIAWQDDRSGRRAVINGFLLREGAVVSGAKITDIYSNRVRFLSAAGQFEIKLDALLPAEVKK